MVGEGWDWSTGVGGLGGWLTLECILSRCSVYLLKRFSISQFCHGINASEIFNTARIDFVYGFYLPIGLGMVY